MEVIAGILVVGLVATNFGWLWYLGHRDKRDMAERAVEGGTYQTLDQALDAMTKPSPTQSQDLPEPDEVDLVGRVMPGESDD